MSNPPTPPRVYVFEEYERRAVELDRSECDRLWEFKDYFDLPESQPVGDPPLRVAVRATSYIGVVGLSPTLTLIVNPKISSSEFFAMLQVADTKRARVWRSVAEHVGRDVGMVDFLVTMFLTRACELLERQVRRAYAPEITRGSSPRGRVLVGKTLREARPPALHFTCRYHAYSPNNPHNQVIRYTLERVRPIIPRDTRRAARKLDRLLEGVSSLPWTPAEVRRLPYDRLTKDYETVHTLCRFLLERFAFRFAEDTHQFLSFLMNSWDVFEQFLRVVFTRYQSSYHVDAYVVRESSATFNWAQKTTRPDLIFSDGAGPRFVVDAKYKSHPTPGDFNQLYRYVGTLGLCRGALVCPCDAAAPQPDSVVEDHMGPGQDPVFLHVIHVDLTLAGDHAYLVDFVRAVIHDLERGC